ncbi:MAG TPA: MFS transporter [Terriglobales bacterium]|jgi:MFS family permease|nr:MFS transporter [Terriglobales bacterium]
MRSILQKPALRFIFVANVVSMLGSGMNTAAVAWFVLQATHSPIALGMFVVIQTIPAMLMLPFTGVIIDRGDRRRLVMMLDGGRAIVILAVSVLAFHGKAKIWELYLMNMLVSAGFWMFWPTITALIQELTPGEDFVHANTFLLAGIQGGWLMAGALVGFVYNHIGLGGVLLIDFSTYIVSFLCYLAVRKGRHVVPRPEELRTDLLAAETAVARFLREMKEGIDFLRGNRNVVMIGISWALFLGAMSAGGVVTAPLSDLTFHAGAVGYGWLNAGWGTGAFLSILYAPQVIASFGGKRSIGLSMGLVAICITVAPLSPKLAIAVGLYAVMGSGRGLAGIAMNTSLMEQVPQHFMGRVQNTFYFAGTALQIILALIVGTVAQLNLVAGFSVIGLVYAVGFISASWPVKTSRPVADVIS